MLTQALFEVGVEPVDTRLGLGLAQLQVQFEGRAQGQAVLEGVVTVRGHQGAEAVGAKEGRDTRRQVFLELSRAGDDDPGATRTG